MSWPCRCRICRKRRALRLRPEQYIRPPKCVCGGELRVDEYEKRAHTEQRCYCDGYHFPHRKGSKWCRFSTVELSDADYKSRSYG